MRVTVNTDNRLMSATSLSQELAQLVDALGIGWDRIRRFTDVRGHGGVALDVAVSGVPCV